MDEAVNGREVRCNYCRCIFSPEVLTEKDGDIEFTFFRCAYCGKAFIVSVMDEALRKDTAEYARLARLNRIRRLPEDKQRKLQKLKQTNVQRQKELHSMYIREDGHDDG